MIIYQAGLPIKGIHRMCLVRHQRCIRQGVARRNRQELLNKMLSGLPYQIGDQLPPRTHSNSTTERDNPNRRRLIRLPPRESSFPTSLEHRSG